MDRLRSPRGIEFGAWLMQTRKYSKIVSVFLLNKDFDRCVLLCFLTVSTLEWLVFFFYSFDVNSWRRWTYLTFEYVTRYSIWVLHFLCSISMDYVITKYSAPDAIVLFCNRFQTDWKIEHNVFFTLAQLNNRLPFIVSRHWINRKERHSTLSFLG